VIILIREEIGDLSAYLRNLPPALRRSPYGSVYEQRLTVLRDEEHPIEPGDSQPLGGAIEIKAPWKRD
jgi:hypothetical protein